MIPLHSVSRFEKLMIFARYPEPGLAKTRLIPALGGERAAELHKVLTQHILATAIALKSSRDVAVEVHFTGGSSDEMQILFGAEEFTFIPQCEGSLGDRLWCAVSDAFADGFQRIVIIGTDCPDLSARLLSEAFERLNLADIVIGPAVDGGYTLIGMKSPQRSLFERIDWGSERVFTQTLERCRHKKLSVELLPPLSDVDYPEDLITCRRLGSSFQTVLASGPSDAISIIIPALNEAANLEPVLQSILQVENIEVIVADGGSTDGTQELARQMGCRVVISNRGRGRQMNAGAAVASGDVLLFLHADTILPDNFTAVIRNILNGPAIAGAFRLGIEGRSLSLRLVEWGANLRSRLFALPYGDQAIFIRTDDFFRMGGFPCWPLMEDVHFCRQLKQQGKIVIADSAVKTSARRWQKLGTLRTTVRNQCCLLAYFLGVAPERISLFYNRRRFSEGNAATSCEATNHNGVPHPQEGL